jgi:hypothetical protein
MAKILIDGLQSSCIYSILQIFEKATQRKSTYYEKHNHVDGKTWNIHICYRLKFQPKKLYQFNIQEFNIQECIKMYFRLLN